MNFIRYFFGVTSLERALFISSVTVLPFKLKIKVQIILYHDRYLKGKEDLYERDICENKKGPRIEPCGTPKVTVEPGSRLLLTSTLWILLPK